MNQPERSYTTWNEPWAQEITVFDRVKKTTAEKLHQAAQSLYRKSENKGQQKYGAEIEHFGQRTAGWLERTADYVNEVNPQQIKADLQKQVQQNPGRTLLIAGGIGLLLGALIRRR